MDLLEGKNIHVLFPVVSTLYANSVAHLEDC